MLPTSQSLPGDIQEDIILPSQSSMEFETLVLADVCHRSLFLSVALQTTPVLQELKEKLASWRNDGWLEQCCTNLAEQLRIAKAENAELQQEVEALRQGYPLPTLHILQFSCSLFPSHIHCASTS